MPKIIAVEIDDEGNVRVDVSGYVGDACLEDAARLQKALQQLGLQLKVQAEKRKLEPAVQPISERLKHER